MRCYVILCTLVLGLIWVLCPAHAASPLTANTLRYDVADDASHARIGIMAWFAGTWRGNGLGGVTEEVWSAPEGGKMMGMYRLLKNGKPVFYEFLVLEEDTGNLFFRLKHFDPNLRSWEAQDEREELGFIGQKGNRYHFDGMTIEKASDDAVTIYLAIVDGKSDAQPREEIFQYRRHAN
jgi:hypothetical protein